MPLNADLLQELAKKYIWWKSPEAALEWPERIIAQVMELGAYEDVQRLTDAVDSAYLCQVLEKAEAGIFSARSWAYWHYRLGLAEPGHVPPLPARRVA